MSSKKKKCKEIDLEEWIKKKHLQIKHPDRLLICDNVIFLIEETSVAKKEDFEKIEEIYSVIKSGELTINESLVHKSTRYCGIIHAKRKIDMLVERNLAFVIKKIGIPMSFLHCNKRIRLNFLKFKLGTL
jgi:hypothetical protein